MENSQIHRVSIVFLLMFFGFSACSKSSYLDDDKLYKLEIGSHTFNIPSNYIWAYDTVNGKKIYNPNLHSLYPDFEPRTASNAEVFEMPNWGNGRLVSFYFVDRAKSRTLDEMAAWRSQGKIEKYNFATGLTTYSSNMKYSEYLIGTLPNGDQISFTCSLDELVPYPSCRTTLVFNEDVMLSVSFSKSLLDKWVELCSGFIAKVNDFTK